MRLRLGAPQVRLASRRRLRVSPAPAGRRKDRLLSGPNAAGAAGAGARCRPRGRAFRHPGAGLEGARIHLAVKAGPAPEEIFRRAGLGSRFDTVSRVEIALCPAQGADPSDISWQHGQAPDRNRLGPGHRPVRIRFGGGTGQVRRLRPRSQGPYPAAGRSQPGRLAAQPQVRLRTGPGRAPDRAGPEPWGRAPSACPSMRAATPAALRCGGRPRTWLPGCGAPSATPDIHWHSAVSAGFRLSTASRSRRRNGTAPK